MVKISPLYIGVAVLATFLFLPGCSSTAKRTGDALAFPAAPDKPRYFYERTILSSTDVTQSVEISLLRQMMTGESELVGERFQKPFSVAAHKGVLYVSDTAALSVHRFDFRKQEYQKITGMFRKPLGMDTDDAGNLYVADVMAQSIVVFDPESNPLRVIDAANHVERPTSVAVDGAGEKVFVVDTGGVSNDEHKIAVFNAQTGDFLYRFGTRGKNPGEFNLPREIDMGPDGLLYIVDGGNFRVQVFEQDGTFVRTFGSVGRRTGQFSRPKGIAVDPEGRIYVSDTAFGNFQIFNNEGQLLMFIGSRGPQLEAAKYMLPSGIEADEDGRIYFVDQFQRKVDVFRPAGLAETEGYAALKTKEEKASGEKLNETKPKEVSAPEEK